MNKKPKIIISERDLEKLEALLDTFPEDAFPGKSALEAELGRAEIVAPGDMPSSVVTMNSTVRFRVSASNEEFCLTLIYPEDGDQSGDTLSILAPVGSALFGVSQGDEIDWPSPNGDTLRVRIEEIVYQPERAGK